MGGTREERMAAAAQDYANGLGEILLKFPYQWSNFYDYWQIQGATSSVKTETLRRKPIGLGG